MILRTQLFTGAYLLIALTRKKHHCTGLVCQNLKKTIIIKQFEIGKMLVEFYKSTGIECRSNIW